MLIVVLFQQRLQDALLLRYSFIGAFMHTFLSKVSPPSIFVPSSKINQKAPFWVIFPYSYEQSKSTCPTNFVQAKNPNMFTFENSYMQYQRPFNWEAIHPTWIHSHHTLNVSLLAADKSYVQYQYTFPSSAFSGSNKPNHFGHITNFSQRGKHV